MKPSERYTVLIGYLHAKVDERDWHAVADVACDLREMEARFPELKTEPVAFAFEAAPSA